MAKLTLELGGRVAFGKVVRMRLVFSGSVAVAVLTFLPASLCGAAPPDDATIDFVRDIQPILTDHCYDCHGADEQEGQLRMDARAAVMQGGVSGRLLTPGKGAGSLLVRRLRTADEEERMPLDEAPLSDEQIARITRWIDQGAHWPDGVGAKVAVRKQHWAYTKPHRPELPQVRHAAWPRNPIDRFVLARLEHERLEPATEAAPSIRLRRVYLDLIGLPPSVAEVDAFVKDPSPAAYAAAVDRLLESPRFGEKWARQWLDLARYSDSNGFQADQLRDLWAYRDWVIEALNDDMPYDRFTIEQIAGDLLPDATIQQKIATGFHRTPTCNVEAGVDPEENRTNQVIDRVNTTATVWLGTTLECAQCHNHKYDPFTQKDYYRLFAYFNNTPLEVVNGDGKVRFDFYGPKMEVPSNDGDALKKAAIESEIAALRTQLEALKDTARGQQPAWEQRVRATQLGESNVHVLEIRNFESSGGSTYKALDDQSILIGGKWPSNDTYTVTVSSTLDDIRGFRLEALSDASLPDGGPGRGETPNFVLNEFTVSMRSGDDQRANPVGLHGAASEYSQPNWPVAGAIDGDPKTGWAIAKRFGASHAATFLTDQPVGDPAGATFVFTLAQTYGRTRAIGRLRLSALTGEIAPAMPADLMKILAKPAQRRSRAERTKIDEHYLATRPGVASLQARIRKLDKQLAGFKKSTTLVMVEMDKARPTHVFRRGQFLDPAEAVTPGVPAALHALPKGVPANRLGLARWLVDAENPIVARVRVNHLWAEIFGRGLVRSVEDFGTQGESPSHPDLLDWLAVEFATSGWSTKQILKRIVTSATYQQSSRTTPLLSERDPHNILLARGPRFRLSAETIRDNALSISGLLNTKMGGPPVYPPQPAGIWRQTGRNEPKYVVATDAGRFRRGVYVVWRRVAPYPSFVNFDAPDRTRCNTGRPRTNTPMQALTLLNDAAYVEMALALAAKVLSQQPEAAERQRIEEAFRRCVARRPQQNEVEVLLEMLKDEQARFAADPAAAGQLLRNARLPDGVARPADDGRWAAWFCIANVLLNLDETITKE